MISLYSNWWIKPGNEEKAIPLLRKLAKKVQKKEKGTLTYLVHYTIQDFSSCYDFKSEPATRPGAVTFFECYASWQDFDNHVNGPIFKKFVKKHGHLFVQASKKKGKESGPFIQVVFLDRVAGFVRS